MFIKFLYLQKKIFPPVLVKKRYLSWRSSFFYGNFFFFFGVLNRFFRIILGDQLLGLDYHHDVCFLRETVCSVCDWGWKMLRSMRELPFYKMKFCEGPVKWSQFLIELTPVYAVVHIWIFKLISFPKIFELLRITFLGNAFK